MTRTYTLASVPLQDVFCCRCATEAGRVCHQGKYRRYYSVLYQSAARVYCRLRCQSLLDSRAYFPQVIYICSHCQPNCSSVFFTTSLGSCPTLCFAVRQALLQGQQTRLLNVHEYISMDIMKTFGIATPSVCLRSSSSRFCISSR